MEKTLRLAAPAVLAAFAFALAGGLALAQDKPATPRPSPPAVDIEGSDRILAGGSVRLAEPVSGDLLGMGGDFEIAAPVSGDATIGAGNVRVSAPVGGELRAGGGNVVLASKVRGEAYLAGGNVEVTSEAEVGGDLGVAGGDVEIRGPVRGDVHVAGGDVLIDAEVGGDVHAGAGELRLGPNARIGGRVVHRSGQVRRDPGAEVAGGVERPKSRRKVRHETRIVNPGSGTAGWIWTFGVVALAALIAGAFPAVSRALTAQLRAQPGMSLVLGFATLVCVPLAAVILMITIIGIPVALAVLMLYFLLLLVGYAAAGVVAGDAALARFRAQDAGDLAWRIGAAVLAMLAISLLGRVPFIGNVVVFAALIAGIGAIVLWIARRDRVIPTAA